MGLWMELRCPEFGAAQWRAAVYFSGESDSLRTSEEVPYDAVDCLVCDYLGVVTYQIPIDNAGKFVSPKPVT